MANPLPNTKKGLFKSKWFYNAFYWLTPENFEPLQKTAFEMGLRWHTGDTDVSPFCGQKNLVMFPNGKIQGVDVWHPDAPYGPPKNFAEMLIEYQSLPKNVPSPTPETDAFEAAQHPSCRFPSVLKQMRKLERGRNEWKANHDNQVALKRVIAVRPDLKDRAPLVEKLMAENTRLREALEKFRGQFDCYECTGTAEDALDSRYMDEVSGSVLPRVLLPEVVRAHCTALATAGHHHPRHARTRTLIEHRGKHLLPSRLPARSAGPLPV